MSSATELKVIMTKLSEYFSKLNLNLQDTVNPLPSFEDYIDLFVYDTILTEARQGIERAASFSTGALADTVHQVLGINREFSMRVKTKVFYFADAEVDTARDSQYYQDLYGRYFNYYRGTSPEQGLT